jgi:hypothetical protein
VRKSSRNRCTYEITRIALVVFLCLFPCKTNLAALGQQAAVSSDLEFHSSNPQLNRSFLWAKQQALAYVRPAASPIGQWYEAALPGRNAFCMRDVSHQTTGAAALGLNQANHNMLTRFANAIASSRDWAGYWEIDEEGKPSTADYVSDSDFWYNLPSNFDVLNAIVRMWRWTGDDSYRNDPRMQFFFRKTMTDYIQQWQLNPDSILNRPRIANQRLREGKFVASRGIPSYTEGTSDFILGSDLLAAEYRAMRSYNEIASTAEDRHLAERLQSLADQIQRILEAAAWSDTGNHFNGIIRRDRSGFGSGDAMVLYFDAAGNPSHIAGALAYVSNTTYWKKVNIEEESYLPALLFRYGQVNAAYQVLLDLSAENKARREYPEVSFAVIAAIVTGAMGVEPSHPGDPFDVRTLSQPITKNADLSLASLHIKGNLLDITDHGEVSMQMVNRGGPTVRWKAAFKGNLDRIYVNGRPKRPEHGTMFGEAPISWIITSVEPRSSVIVSRKESTARSHD